MIRKPRKRRGWTIWVRCSNVRVLKQIHASMVVHGFNSNPSDLRELIYTAAVEVTGIIDYAHKLFTQISKPDVFIWNTIIRGSAQSYNPLSAISYYNQMEKTQIKPDKFTFPFVLKACTRVSWILMGTQFHGKIVKSGFEMDTFVRNSLINLHACCGDLHVAKRLFDASCEKDVVAWSSLTAGYAKRGELVLARKLFDEMPVKDLVSWNVMISSHAKNGDMENAHKLFDEIPERDVVTWNAMISGYVSCGSCEKALMVFEEMQMAGEKADEITIISLLSACADSGALDLGKKIHHSLIKSGSRYFSTILGNALIDMYSKCGSIYNALEIFQVMKEKDISTWNSIICGLAFHGHGQESMNLFDEMLKDKVMPNEITFVGLLVACSHIGTIEQGQQYFDLMRFHYKIEPNIKHYGCMVDILGRAGLLKEAFEFIETMEIKPNPIIWRTMLGACRVHGNVELAEKANRRLLELRLDQSGDYVLLSNIYASVGKWGGVEKVRRLMEDRGVKKEPGCSLVEEDCKGFMHSLKA